MTRFWLTLLAFFAAGTLAQASLGPFESSEGQTDQISQEDQIGAAYFECLENKDIDHLGRSERVMLCKKQVGEQIEEIGGSDLQANWQWLICLEQQSSLNGGTYSDVAGLCRQLSSFQDEDSDAASTAL